MTKSLCLALLLSLGIACQAQSPGVLGDWRTPGGAVLRVAPCAADAKMLCVLLQQLEPNPPGRLDTNNPDRSQRTRPLCGLAIGYGFVPAGPDRAEDGHLYDPKSGKTYHGSMASTGDQLALRGYIGFKALGRTETWKRTEPTAQCH